jgi:isopropylmalate/homocitrate/citramalate synthase
MFGKPKRVKGLGKPRTAEESVAVKKALKAKYPQMYEAGWGKAKRKDESAVGKIRQAGKDRDASLEAALTPAELKKLGYKRS